MAWACHIKRLYLLSDRLWEAERAQSSRRVLQVKHWLCATSVTRQISATPSQFTADYYCCALRGQHEANLFSLHLLPCAVCLGQGVIWSRNEERGLPCQPLRPPALFSLKLLLLSTPVQLAE